MPKNTMMNYQLHPKLKQLKKKDFEWFLFIKMVCDLRKQRHSNLDLLNCFDIETYKQKMY